MGEARYYHHNLPPGGRGAILEAEDCPPPAGVLRPRGDLESLGK